MALSPRTMQIELYRCNSVPCQDTAWETCECTVTRKQATSIAYPQLRACRGSPLLEGSSTYSSEWVGAHRQPVSLSDLIYLCPLWDTCLVLCVDLASMSSSRFPALAPSPGQDQAFPVAWFRWLLYNRIFSPTREALVSCSVQVFWHLEHTV